MESYFAVNGYEVGSYVGVRDCGDLQRYISIHKNRRLSVVCASRSCDSGCLCVNGCTRFAHLPGGLSEVAWLRAGIQDERTGIVCGVAIVVFLCALLHRCGLVCVGCVIRCSGFLSSPSFVLLLG